MISNIVFFILLLAIVVVTIIATAMRAIDSLWESYGYHESTLAKFFGTVWRFLWVGALSVAGAIMIAAAYQSIVSSAIKTRNDGADSITYELKALGNGTETEGQYSGGIFLSRGYVNEKPVVNYIRAEEGGAVTIRSSDAGTSYIYETNSKDPEVIEHRWYGYDPLWYEGKVYGGTTYQFYIPEGSIDDSYEVSVTK